MRAQCQHPTRPTLKVNGKQWQCKLCVWGNIESHYLLLGFPGESDDTESACNVGDLSSIPRLGRSPGQGNGNPPQYSCLDNRHGQRKLGGGGCSLWDHKESDMTDGLKLFSRRWTWKVLHFPFHKEIKNGQNRQSLSGSMTRPAWTASITKDSKIKSLPQWRGCNDSYGWSMLMYGRN